MSTVSGSVAMPKKFILFHLMSCVLLNFIFPCIGLEASIATSSHELSIPNDVSYIICYNYTQPLLDTMSVAVHVTLNAVFDLYTDPQK